MVGPVIVVMGVSGSGKTSIGRGLAARLGWKFQEGDALHPPANIARMHAGIPLDDADRWPWLDAIAVWIEARIVAGEPGIVTCSALKRAYRDRLRRGRDAVRILYLQGGKALIAARLAARQGHFMPPGLLDSQFATLEPPAADERPIIIDTAGTTEAIINAALVRLTAEVTAASAAARMALPGPA